MNHPTRELLDAFIEGWLDAISNPPRYFKSVTAHCEATLASNSFEPKPNWDQMPTPPPSASTPTRSARRSPKRPRHEDSFTSQLDHGFTDDSPFDNDNDKTPSASSQTQNLSAMSLPTRPLLSQPPSLSSTSSARSRSTSPVKRSTLQLLEKPVFFVPIAADPTTQLPEGILPTYDRIIAIADHENFLLPSSQGRTEGHIHRRNRVKPHWFFDQADDDDSAAKHLQELSALREIEQAAKTCQTEEASEAVGTSKSMRLC